MECSLSLNSKVIMSFLAGLFSAALAWVVVDFNGVHRISLSSGATVLQMFREQAFLGAVFGVFLGIAIAGVNGISSGSGQQLRRNVAWGALVGLGGGIMGLYVGQAFFGVLYKDPKQAASLSMLGPLVFIWDVAVRAIGWAFIGLFVGMVQGLPSRSSQSMKHGAIGGLIGGFLGGSLFEIVPYLLPATTHDPSVISRGVGMTVTGASIGFFVGLVENLLKQAWVRVVMGRNEGKEYIISKPRTTIGRDELSDIPLFGDRNIATTHAVIDFQNGRRVLQDAGSPIGSSVNGQRVTAQALKDGDVIQVGSMSLEFHEKATMSRIPAPVDQPKQSVKIPDMAGICSFCGTKKDASGRCACSVGGQTADPGLQQPPMPTIQQSTPMSQPTMGMPAAPSPGSGPRLVGLAGPYAGQAFQLSPDGPTSVGREPGRDMQISADTTVSRRHARVENEGGMFVVYDEGSSNGTSVNGARISRQPISPGDVVEFGSSAFRFES